jgi:hypothetical protein
MSYAVGKTAQTTLLAFLIWNALGHATKRLSRTTYQQFRSYWAATRQRYTVLLIKYESKVPFSIPSFSVKNALIGDIFGAVIVIVLASSLFGTVANFTTGITIAHTGFTPNTNVTQSIGFVPIIQLIPFVFGAMVLVMVYAIFQRHLPGGF